jgi:hypothetical protein
MLQLSGQRCNRSERLPPVPTGPDAAGAALTRMRAAATGPPIQLQRRVIRCGFVIVIVISRGWLIDTDIHFESIETSDFNDAGNTTSEAT